MATCVSVRSATSRQVSMACGVVPQSSCSFRPSAPAWICSSSGAGSLALPLPSRPIFIANASVAPSMAWICHGPGECAGRRTGAAAYHGCDTGGDGLFDLLRADKVNMGIDAARGNDKAFSGNNFCAGTDNDGDTRLDIRIAGFADGRDMAVLDP